MRGYPSLLSEETNVQYIDLIMIIVVKLNTRPRLLT